MLTATPASNGAPADSAAKADRGAAERCACCARAAWYAVGRAARGEGDADRGPLQALNPTSRRHSRRTSPLSNEGLAVCVSFRQFSVLLVETQQFSLDRMLRADEHESSPTQQVGIGCVFW